jgi:hypothetical protein
MLRFATAGTKIDAQVRDVVCLALGSAMHVPWQTGQVADDRQHAIDEIVQSARQVRPRTPRWLWLLAGVLGLGCAIAFVIVLVSDGDPGGPTAGAPPATNGMGFGAGLALGVGIGIAVGFAIARQLVRDHSSRNNP